MYIEYGKIIVSVVMLLHCKYQSRIAIDHSMYNNDMDYFATLVILAIWRFPWQHVQMDLLEYHLAFIAYCFDKTVKAIKPCKFFG